MSDTDTDFLVPDPQVATEFSVSLMTLWRWDHDAALGFPPAVKIKGRKFRSRQQLDAFKARLFKQALAERATPRRRTNRALV